MHNKKMKERVEEQKKDLPQRERKKKTNNQKNK